ncbi:ABC transporter permease [Nocardiopsis alba]|uniref:ABC transporter permease n=1 Tax=Nocardiopsis alba TaxID=53437 RepID=UPI00382F1322
MSAFFTLVLKDLRQRLKDGTLLVFAIVLPLGLAFLLNMLLGGDPETEFTAHYGVSDLDGGELSSLFVDEVLESLEEEGIVELTTLSSEDDANEAVDSGDVSAAFVIPEGFTEALRNDESAEIRVIGDVDSPEEVEVAVGIAEAFASEHHRVQLAVLTTDPSSEEEAALTEQAAGHPTAVRVVEDTDVDRRQLDSSTYYAAGAAVFFLFFAAMPGVVSLFEDRRTGTLVRLAAAPIGTFTILMARLASTLLFGLVSMGLVITVSTLTFGARWGDPLEVAALTVAAVLAAVGIVSAVAGFADNSEQATNWSTVVALLLGLMGGALFPLANLGPWAALTYVTPHYWFLRGLTDLTAGGGAVSLLLPIGVLSAMGVAGVAVALNRMGRMLHA